MERKIKIEGMSCRHCQGRVAKLLELTEGISNVSVSLDNKEAVFTCESGVEISNLVEAINALGFTASAFSK